MISAPFRTQEMAWLDVHFRRLANEYPGEWLAIDGEELVASSAELAEVLQEAASGGHAQPLLTAIPGERLSGPVFPQTAGLPGRRDFFETFAVGFVESNRQLLLSRQV